jgi:predicted transcriptional regulator
VFGEIPAEQVRDAVERTARETLAEAQWHAPPVDAEALARRLGLAVARDGVGAATRARFVRHGGAAGQGAIYVADDPRRERRQWAVAHEIGESRAWRVFAELGVQPVDAAERAREEVANRLAGCLLLPWEWFAADGDAAEWDLLELKARYATASHELVARRMLEMRPAVIVTMLDQGRVVWRRSNALARPPAMTPPERDAWEIAHATGQAIVCERSELPEGVDDVRVWPVHEEGWKREIVRTALSELD